MARTPLPFDGEPFTTGAALRAGIGRGRLRGPDLVRPFRGVQLPVSASDDLSTRCRGLLLRVPQGAVCGVTAASLWGAPLPGWAERAPVQITVAEGTAPIGRGLKGHRMLLAPGDVVERAGIRLTIPARTWCDLGAVLSLPDLVAVGDHLIRRGSALTALDQLAEHVARSRGRRGVRALTEALELLDTGSESRRETRLRVLLVRHGFTDLVANVSIRTSEGYRYRGDLVSERLRLVIEYQSAFHDDSVRQRADMTRRSRLQADGWLVIEVSRDDLADPAALVARIRRTILTHRTPATP